MRLTETKRTQAQKCLDYLRRNGRATIRELMQASGSNWPHKRVSEITDDGGWVYVPNGTKWHGTGEKIIRESALRGGRWITVYRLAR